jgi:hypothetical protein
VQDKDVGQWPEESKAESRLDVGLQPTGDEKFDLWNPFDQSTHHGENGGLGVSSTHSPNVSRMIMLSKLNIR